MTTFDSTVARVGLGARVAHFFHDREVPYGIALIRILLPVGLFCAMAVRWPHAREIFSSDGAPTPLWANYGTPAWFPEPSGAMAVAIVSVLLLALFTTCIGWCTRISLVIATVGYFVLNMLDIISTMTKYSAIASHLMFLMCFSECGAVWSVDNWLRRSRLKRSGAPPELYDQPRRFCAAPRRLLQLLIALIYFGAAVTKMHTPAFFTGEQLQTWMITDYNFPNLLGSRFALHPAVCVAFAYVSIVWEILFISLVWRRAGRFVMLALGVFFHAMTWLTLGLYVFPLVCITAYFVFVDENDIESVRRLLSRWRAEEGAVKRFFGAMGRPRTLWTLPAIEPVASNAIFASLAVIVAIGGVGLERLLDPYGVRRADGPYALRELDPDMVAELLVPTTRIKNEDKVFTFDVGTILSGGALLDRRSQFRPGDTLQAQCGLNPPHEALWVECNLHDGENRLVENLGYFVSSDAMKATFSYSVGHCIMPGDYSLVLKIAGEEIMRRPIRILPSTKACAAN